MQETPVIGLQFSLWVWRDDTSCLINPVEDVTAYKGTSLGSFSVVGSAEIAAGNRVIADLPDHPQGQHPDKYDFEEARKQ